MPTFSTVQSYYNPRQLPDSWILDINKCRCWERLQNCDDALWLEVTHSGRVGRELVRPTVGDLKLLIEQDAGIPVAQQGFVLHMGGGLAERRAKRRACGGLLMEEAVVEAPCELAVELESSGLAVPQPPRISLDDLLPDDTELNELSKQHDVVVWEMELLLVCTDDPMEPFGAETAHMLKVQEREDYERLCESEWVWGVRLSEDDEKQKRLAAMLDWWLRDTGSDTAALAGLFENVFECSDILHEN